MDNLTHTLCGAALAKSRLGRMSRLAPWSLVVGANLPDVDVVVRLFGGKEAFLVHHRGITHSLVGIVVQTLLLAAGVRWLERRSAVAGEAPRPWSAFLLPAFAGLASHPLLDLLNNYGLRPWLPFSPMRYYGDLVFIVDPLLWLLFGATAALAGPRTPAGSWFWAALAAFTSWLVYTNERTPDPVRWYWPFALVAIGGLRLAGVGRDRPRRLLATGATLLALYLGGLELAASVARRGRDVDDGQGGTAPLAMRSPRIADPFSWTLWFETPTRWLRYRADAGGRFERDASVERHLDDPRARIAAASPRAYAWRYFARLPFARVEEHADGGCTVILSDARFHSGRDPDWCSVEIELPAPDRDGGP